MANPLACAVANASLELVESSWKDDVPRIARLLDDHLAPARDLPGVADVRTLGAVGVVQLDGPVDVTRVTRAALERGVWVRPFRDLVYTMPPYVCTDDDVVAHRRGHRRRRRGRALVISGAWEAWLAERAELRRARGTVRSDPVLRDGLAPPAVPRCSTWPPTTTSASSQDERVVAAAHAALDRYGASATASRLVTGTLPVHRELEAVALPA